MALFYHFFRYPIPYATQEGLQMITAVGVGLSLSTPILILQAAMPLKDMAAATSAWQLTRSLGGSIGQSPLLLPFFPSPFSCLSFSPSSFSPTEGKDFVVV